MVTRSKHTYRRRPLKHEQVHLLVQFIVQGGERATFLVRNISKDFEAQLDIVSISDAHLHQFYLALLRKSQSTEGRVTWNPNMIDIEGLTKIRTYALKSLPVHSGPDTFRADIVV